MRTTGAGLVVAEGVPGNSIQEWAFGPAAGSTASQAVANLVPSFRVGGTVTAEQVAVGYPDASPQTWFVLRDRKPYVVVLVTQLGGDAFRADPDRLCTAP